MKRYLKIAGITAGVIIVLLIAAVVIIPLLVDINDYKPRIASLVEKQTGRQLKIEGDIRLSIFPWLGVQLGAVELGNAPGFEAPVFAQVKQLQIRMKILPLLSKRLETDVVSVRGLSVNLERNKEGRTNWDDLIKTQPEKKPETVEKPTLLETGAMVIGGVNVSDASVSWVDRTSGQRLTVSDLSVKTSAVTLVDPLDVKVGFAVDAGDLGLQGRVDTGTRITINLKDNVITLKDIQLNADLKGKMLPGGKATLKGDGAVAFNANSRQLDFSRLKLAASGLSLPPYTADVQVEAAGSGDLAVQTFNLTGLKAALTMTAGKERIQAELSGKVNADLNKKKVAVSDLSLGLPELNTEALQVKLSALQRASATFDLAAMTLLIEGIQIAGTVSGKSIPGGSLPVKFGFRVKGDLNRETVSIDPLQLEALGMKTDGGLSVAKFKTAPEIKGALTVARFNPKGILAQLVKDLPDFADPKTLSSAELSIAFSADPNRVKVDKLTANIDDSRLTGSAAVKNFSSPDVQFEFAMDRLHLDRYLPSQKSGVKTSAAAAPAQGAAAAAGLPLEALRKLSIDGKFRLSELTASGLKMNDLAVGFRAKDGIIRTEPLTASLYDGSFSGAVELDVRNKEPKLTFDEKLSNVRLDRMLKALAVSPGKLDLSGPSSVAIKGSVVTDPALKIIQVGELAAGGKLANRLAFGLDGNGTLVNLNDQTLTAEHLNLNLDDMKLQIKTKVTGLLTTPSYKADIHIPAFNLRRMLEKIGQTLPETSDPKTMTVFETAASVSESDGMISVEPLKVRLDDTRLEGKLSVSSKPAPIYAFDIRVDAMDADRYLPPKKTEKGSKPAPASPGSASAALPTDALKTLNLDGKLTVGKLKIANLRIQDIQFQAKAKDGRLTLSPLQAGLYGGTYNGNISIDASGQKPQFALDEKLDKVQIGPLLKDLQGKALLTGNTNAGIKLTAIGADTDAIRRTLNGKAELQFIDGSIEKLDIAGKICRAISGISAGSLKKEDLAAGVMQMVTQQAKGDEKQLSGRTEFSEMGGTLVFKNGIGTNEDLTLKSPLLRVEGSGKVDLPGDRLDYQATVALVKSCEGQGGRSFRELANYPIPVTISGPMDDLNVKPNLTAGLVQMLKPQQTTEQPPSGTQQQALPAQPQQPADPKKQAEEAIKGVLQKGLQDFMKKQ